MDAADGIHEAAGCGRDVALTRSFIAAGGSVGRAKEGCLEHPEGCGVQPTAAPHSLQASGDSVARAKEGCLGHPEGCGVQSRAVPRSLVAAGGSVAREGRLSGAS